MSLHSDEIKKVPNNKEIDMHIYNAILDAILNRQLKPDTRLVEVPLCEAFGVTRGVIRRIFVKLERTIKSSQFSLIVVQLLRNTILKKQKPYLRRVVCWDWERLENSQNMLNM